VKDANQTYANSNVRSIYLADRDLNALPQGVLGNVSGRRHSRAVLVYDERVKDSWEQWTNSVNGAAVNYSNQTKADYDNYLATACLFWTPVITAEAPSRLGGSVVTFTPGARTAWHSHPVGQTLFCLSGVGRICFKGEKPQVLNPGDTVNIPPDTMHWHGAAPDRLFSHLALSEAGEQGQGTAWDTHVSDAEYNEAASGG